MRVLCDCIACRSRGLTFVRWLLLFMAALTAMFALTGCRGVRIPCVPGINCPEPQPSPTPTPVPTPSPSPSPTPLPTPPPLVCSPPTGAFQPIDATPRRVEKVDAAVAVVQLEQPQLFDRTGRLWETASGRLWTELSTAEQVVLQDTFFGFVVAALAQRGVCGILWGDAIGVKRVDGLWEEYHLVNHGGGAVIEARFAYRGAFIYGPEPSPTPSPDPATCDLVVSQDHPVRLKLDEKQGAAGARWLDLTPEYFYGVNADGTNAGPCGDPTTHAPRRWCAIGVDGGPRGVVCEQELVGTPQWNGGPVELETPFRGNPFLARIVSGSGWVEVCGEKLLPQGEAGSPVKTCVSQEVH